MLISRCDFGIGTNITVLQMKEIIRYDVIDVIDFFASVCQSSAAHKPRNKITLTST